MHPTYPMHAAPRKNAARTLVAIACLGLSQIALAVDTIAVKLVAGGLTAPNRITHAGDGSGRLFIVDQPGQVRIVDAAGALLPTPFLDIASKMVPLGAFGPGSFDERGLLSLAFHPNYAANGRFYVYYSAPQPPPDPITFEATDTIPSDVTFTGGIFGTQFVPPLYCSGARSFEVSAGASATIEFAEPVIKTRFFFVHRTGAGAGSIEAILNDGSSLGVVASNPQTVRCDPAHFVEFEDLGFPVVGIKRLELISGAGVGLTLFLDDLEITRFNHKGRLSEFTVSIGDPNVADALSERVILEIDEPQFNHNAGNLAFGPNDGLLYVSVGDGGNANDVGPFHNATIGNGQDKTNLLGSILRVDVDGDDFPGDASRNYAVPVDNPFVAVAGCSDGCDETWAYGLRNPFRFSFDSGGTHRLFCGDVGQDLFEEITIVSAGENHGWNTREGLHCFDPATPGVPPVNCSGTGPSGEPLIDPILEFPHTAPVDQPQGIAVMGGFVHRGGEFTGLAGKYVFGDWSRGPFGGPIDGSVFVATEAGPGSWTLEEPTISNVTGGRLGLYVLGLGQDAAGEIYVCTSGSIAPFGTTGAVHKVVPSKGDMNADGLVTVFDVPTFVDVLTGVNTDPALLDRANVNGDASTDGGDIQGFVGLILGP